MTIKRDVNCKLNACRVLMSVRGNKNNNRHKSIKCGKMINYGSYKTTGNKA